MTERPIRTLAEIAHFATSPLGRAFFVDALRGLATDPYISVAVEKYLREAAAVIEYLAANLTTPQASAGTREEERTARELIDLWEATFDITVVAEALTAERARTKEVYRADNENAWAALEMIKEKFQADVSELKAALATAHSRGAAEMRERAAKEADLTVATALQEEEIAFAKRNDVDTAEHNRHWTAKADQYLAVSRAAKAIAIRIRQLPLSEEGKE